MGAGKAFGSVCEKYELGEYTDFNTLLKNNNAIVSGSEMLKLYFAYNKLVLKNDFEANDLDIFVQKKVIKTETVDGFNKEITNIDLINKFLESKGYKGGPMKHFPRNYLDFVSKDLIKVFEYKKESSEKKIQIIVVKSLAMKYINTFDLSCCMYYWDSEKEIVDYCGKEEYRGTMKSEFNLEFTKYNSIHRAKKYIDRGFELYYKNRNIDELLKFMDNKCHKVGISDLKDFFESKPRVVIRPPFLLKPVAVVNNINNDKIDALEGEVDGGKPNVDNDHYIEDFNPRRIRDRINKVTYRKYVQESIPKDDLSKSFNSIVE